jgi:hypothetical protein
MADEGPTTVWMVGEPDYDSCSHHAVFTSRADADAYAALNTDWHVEEMPLYRSGTMPAIVEAWSATAAVRRHQTTAMTSSTLGHTSMTVYDNEPPTLRCYRFSELEALPIWAKQPCDVTRCDLNGDVLTIRFQGSDRDAVLEACQQRYEAGLDAMGARR